VVENNLLLSGGGCGGGLGGDGLLLSLLLLLTSDDGDSLSLLDDLLKILGSFEGLVGLDLVGEALCRE